MGTGQFSRPGGRQMILTRGESTCPTMLAASKDRDIWPVRLLANTSPSGNIPGIPWISQTMWRISPNIRSSAEACQDSVGQRGASTVENDPWSTSLQWIPEPGTAWPHGRVAPLSTVMEELGLNLDGSSRIWDDWYDDWNRDILGRSWIYRLLKIRPIGLKAADRHWSFTDSIAGMCPLGPRQLSASPISFSTSRLIR